MTGHWEPARSGDDDPYVRVGTSLDRVTKSLGMARSAALGDVFGRWADVVGAAIAAHAKPVSLVRGKLTVAVDHPTWATELRYLESSLLGRIAEAVGDGVVTSVEVRVSRS